MPVVDLQADAANWAGQPAQALPRAATGEAVWLSADRYLVLDHVTESLWVVAHCPTGGVAADATGGVASRESSPAAEALKWVEQQAADLRGIVKKYDVRGVAGTELTEEIARDRLAHAQIGMRLGVWLDDAEHRQVALREMARVARVGLQRIDEKEVRTFLTDVVLPRLAEEPAS